MESSSQPHMKLTPAELAKLVRVQTRLFTIFMNDICKIMGEIEAGLAGEDLMDRLDDLYGNMCDMQIEMDGGVEWQRHLINHRFTESEGPEKEKEAQVEQRTE